MLECVDTLLRSEFRGITAARLLGYSNAMHTVVGLGRLAAVSELVAEALTSGQRMLIGPDGCGRQFRSRCTPRRVEQELLRLRAECVGGCGICAGARGAGHLDNFAGDHRAGRIGISVRPVP